VLSKRVTYDSFVHFYYCKVVRFLHTIITHVSLYFVKYILTLRLTTGTAEPTWTFIAAQRLDKQVPVATNM
jgi:hypothetical protein